MDKKGVSDVRLLRELECAGPVVVLSPHLDDAVFSCGAGVVFAPLGIGRHVDHLITRAAAPHLGLRTVYYSDFPYSRTSGPDAGFVGREGLVPHRWLSGRAENSRRIAGYRTQFAGLFPGGTVPTWPEVYWVTADGAPRTPRPPPRSGPPPTRR
jgi:hypothetical protein